LLVVYLLGNSIFASAEQCKTMATLGESDFPSIESFFREDQNYKQVKTPADLVDGTIIEGSTRYGGIQPDYRVSLQHPSVVAFLAKVKELA
ncbi:hypothetical protein ACSTK4_23465, partial [Vibrio parahaemolyticus]